MTAKQVHEQVNVGKMQIKGVTTETIQRSPPRLNNNTVFIETLELLKTVLFADTSVYI